jgi:glycyl-tRNA synthetase beta chain
MAESRPLLVELGTEELPPKALKSLAEAFRDGVTAGLAEASLSHGEVRVFATPRRLALKIGELVSTQEDRPLERRGPPVRVAIDGDGRPTKAGEKFAASCGVEFDALERLATEKGEYLVYRGVEPGRATTALLPEIVAAGLDGLPVPRPMHWSDHDFTFVRPVHWLVVLYGNDIVDATLYGHQAGRRSRGHRFHAPAPIEISSADDYPGCLEHDGYVIADFEARRERLLAATEALARELGGQPVFDDALLDEVTALVEWPVAMAGRFERHFLDLPREVLISTLQLHQRYFPVAGQDGTLLDHFITVANIESRDPDQVVRGNERVVRPRLADAAFFWNGDREMTLAERRDALREVVFQRGLGSMFEKSERVAALAGEVATALDEDVAAATRAAALAKCDLLTDMVGEFPDLQGVMGRYYAMHDGESADVATAIEEQYLPRYAGDRLPVTGTGRVLAIADKLDTLAGVFGIGQRPSGNRDPFGLRRSALGVLRILVEDGLDLDLPALLSSAAGRIPGVEDPAALARELYDYMMERLRSYYTEGAGSVRATIGEFESVLEKKPASPLDFHRRLEAVQRFSKLPAAESLAAANKRVANILRQAGLTEAPAADPDRLVEAEEKILFDRVETLAQEVEPLLDERRYDVALERLATLREPVDAFFDSVMVMADDEALRQNRLALLARMRNLFLRTADLSRLGG